MKATAIAPSNVAFIKYWGRVDDVLRIPINSSISMNLNNLYTTTTVLFSPEFLEDSLTIDNESVDSSRATDHLNRIRKLTHTNLKAKIVSKNSFPKSTGLSSSASGFAALTLAATTALGLSLSEKEISILARQASGSACRSIPDGFVEWRKGEDNESSFSHTLYKEDYWDIRDFVIIVSTNKKKVPTSAGHSLSFSSPVFKKRLSEIDEKSAILKKYLKEKNFQRFGQMVEDEALSLHEIMQTSVPPLDYLYPQTRLLMEKVKTWRQKNIPVYFTLNTGQNIHLIVEGKNEKVLKKLLGSAEEVKEVIINMSAKGARVVQNHLF